MYRGLYDHDFFMARPVTPIPTHDLSSSN